MRGRVALHAPGHDVPGCRLPVAPRLWAARGVSGRHVSICRRALPSAARRWRAPRSSISPPRVPAAAVAHYSQVQSGRPSPACPGLRAARGGGGRGGGRAPPPGVGAAWGASRVAGPCPPPMFAIRGSVHWVPGHRLGLCPWFPLPPASPLSRGVVLRGGGGGGRAAWHALCRNVLHQLSAGGAAWRLLALGAAARVSGQQVRRGRHCCARLRVACRRCAPT